MSSKVGKLVVPALRFPEFLSAPGWLETTLGKEATFEKGKGISRAEISSEGTQPCIRYGELYTHYGETIRAVLSHTSVSSDELVLSKKNDVIIPASGESEIDIAKASCVLKSGIALGGDLNIIRSGLNGVFLSYYLNNAKKQAIAKLAQGIAVVHLYASQLKTLTIEVPESSEQTKIADCLSSIDNFIAAEERKIDALKVHKGSLMQQLFTAESQNVPRLRFPTFNKDGKWKEEKAGTLFVNRIEQGEAGLPIYSVTMNDGMIKRSSLDRGFDDIAKPEGNKKVHRHDVAYNMMRMWQGACGVAVEDCMASPAYVVLAPQVNVNSIFYGYLLKLPRYLQILASHSQGLTLDRLRLYYRDFAEILLPHPSAREQKKIADCLSSIDTLLVAHKKKLETLRTHKKGLTQGLFPPVAEAEV